MPSARGVRAGAAYVELYANDKRLARGLKRAQKRLAAFGAFARDIGLKLAMVTAVERALFGSAVIQQEWVGIRCNADPTQKCSSMASSRSGTRRRSVWGS